MTAINKHVYDFTYLRHESNLLFTIIIIVCNTPITSALLLRDTLLQACHLRHILHPGLGLGICTGRILPRPSPFLSTFAMCQGSNI
mmetsp:Transcript_11112/g.22219  ORF Transcript_11112/g.22219 Transcript_11112/m.22219 type:complete len:86 (-) Transcript_11112:435-692(-)